MNNKIVSNNCKLTAFAIPIMNKPILPDHTYVTSSMGFRWKCFGRDAGGKIISSGTGSTIDSICISYPTHTTSLIDNLVINNNCCKGIIYGITGVCHQAANRVLYPASLSVKDARGYFLSNLFFGKYGTIGSDWEKTLAECFITKKYTKKSANLVNSLNGLKGYLFKCQKQDTYHTNVSSYITNRKSINKIEKTITELKINHIDISIDLIKYNKNIDEFVIETNKIASRLLINIINEIGEKEANNLMDYKDTQVNYENYGLVSLESARESLANIREYFYYD